MKINYNKEIIKRLDTIIELLKTEITRVPVKDEPVEKTLEEAIYSLGYDYKYINPEVAKEIKYIGKNKIELFTLGKDANNEEVVKEYKKRGLVPDVFSMIEYLKENPKVLEEKRFIGVNINISGFASFIRWFGGRRVDVDRSALAWHASWCFGGVRKNL